MKECEFSVDFLGKQVPCYYITNIETAQEAIDTYMNSDCPLFGLDTETEPLPEYKHYPKAGLSPHLAKIRLLQIYNGRASVVFDLKHIGHTDIFLPFLNTKRFIAHNALFDLSFLLKMGASEMNIGCTYQLAKLMFHAKKADDAGLVASLGGLMKGLYGTDILKASQTSDWSIPELTFEQVEYAALDAICVMALAEKMASVLTSTGMERYYGLIKAAQYPIAKMQLNGFGLNIPAHKELIDIWLSELNEARKAVTKLTGIEVVTPHSIGEWLEKNLDPLILSAWPRTDSGKLQTDVHAFADFEGVSPIIEPFAQFQKYKTLCSDFGHKLLQQVNPATQRLHSQFKLSGARTGRLSCSQPNLQQLPRTKDVRGNFVASQGKVLVCADYSQVELRVAAEVSQDQVMLKAYRDGIDIHALTASVISGKSIASVTKEDRQMAKAFNFGLLFGLGPAKFGHYAKKAYGISVTQNQANEAIASFRSTYAGYREWQLAQAENASTSLTARTPVGKLRKLNTDNSYGASMNTPIQGGAAECMLYTLVMLQTECDELGIDLVNCVHDEVVVECVQDSELIEEAKAAIERSMVWGFRKVFPNGITRGLCESGVGKSWAEAK